MSDPLKLPGRTPAQEDAWVEELMQGDLQRTEEAVRMALSSGRPQLAGRIVGLLPDSEVRDDEELHRAKRAASLMMVERGAPLDALTEELKELFERRRRKRMRRARRRSRERVSPDKPTGRRRKR